MKFFIVIFHYFKHFEIDSKSFSCLKLILYVFINHSWNLDPSNWKATLFWIFLFLSSSFQKINWNHFYSLGKMKMQNLDHISLYLIYAFSCNGNYFYFHQLSLFMQILIHIQLLNSWIGSLQGSINLLCILFFQFLHLFFYFC